MFIPTAAGVARVRLFWDLGGGLEAQNVFYVDSGEGAVLASAQLGDLATMVYNAWHETGGDTSFWQAQIAPQTELVRIRTEEASLNDGPFHERAVGEFGTAGGVAVPPAVAFVAKFLTDLRGRNNRGRMFCPGLPESHVASNGSIDNVSDLQIALDGIRQATSGWPGVTAPKMVVASFFHQVVPGTPPTVARAVATTTPVTETVVDSFVKSQRRRNQPN